MSVPRLDLCEFLPAGQPVRFSHRLFFRPRLMGNSMSGEKLRSTRKEQVNIGICPPDVL